MVDLEDYNVYLEMYAWFFCCEAPTPCSIVEFILNCQKKILLKKKKEEELRVQREDPA
jgi:hypothetical protein